MTDEELISEYRKYRTKAEASRALGLPITTFKDRLAAAMRRLDIEDGPIAGGRVNVLPTRIIPPPKTGIKRYLLTSAQNNTYLNAQVWLNLLVLAKHYEAELMVMTYTYDKASYRGRSVKGEGPTKEDKEPIWYEPDLAKYIVDDQVQLAPGLVVCGPMNILPTAADPLSGLQAHTGRSSSIFPHAQQVMESVPSGKYEGTKLMYTTGTVTQRNYIQKKEGLKAEQFHTYGALVVEVDSDGDWFVRQIGAGADDELQDLNVLVSDGDIRTDVAVKGIIWGDIHRRQLDPTVRRLAWAEDGMLDTLQPEYQIMHDLYDFKPRNHHDAKNPHVLFQKFVAKEESVSEEVDEAAEFLANESMREWCKTVVVKSNHDDAMERWLREADYKEDPVNAVFYLEAQLEQYKAIEAGEDDFHLLEWACNREHNCKDVIFLRQDESFVLGETELGVHGHEGPNGARGTTRNLSTAGRAMIKAHDHTAAKRKKVTSVGCSCLIDVGYNRGMSTWSWTHAVLYENGCSTLVTMWDNKWRAE